MELQELMELKVIAVMLELLEYQVVMEHQVQMVETEKMEIKVIKV